MRESTLIKFLYNTILGRMLLKVLVNPAVSELVAKFLTSKISRALVPGFIKKHEIDMTPYEVPQGGFASFNEFFTRKMKDIFLWHRNGELVSPCDGLLTVSEINKDSIFYIKHTAYSLNELIKDKELAQYYTGGLAYIFRLTPAHFHRYIWSVSGALQQKRHIAGVLHSVQPVCHEKTDVFIQNTREYSVVFTPSLGEVIQMEVGALLVGRISNHDVEIGEIVCEGEEKGFFEYGGSSIVVITSMKNDLPKEIWARAKYGTEIPVTIGERLI